MEDLRRVHDLPSMDLSRCVHTCMSVVRVYTKQHTDQEVMLVLDTRHFG